MALDLALPDTDMLDTDACFHELTDVETVDQDALNEIAQEVAKAKVHARHACPLLKQACVINGKFNDHLYSYLCGATWQDNLSSHEHFYTHHSEVEQAWKAIAYEIETDWKLEG